MQWFFDNINAPLPRLAFFALVVGLLFRGFRRGLLNALYCHLGFIVLPFLLLLPFSLLKGSRRSMIAPYHP